MFCEVIQISQHPCLCERLNRLQFLGKSVVAAIKKENPIVHYICLLWKKSYASFPPKLTCVLKTLSFALS